MSFPPGGVWLDARGTQSVAHAERGIARYIAEQTRALIEAAPEVDRLGRTRSGLAGAADRSSRCVAQSG